MRKHDMKLSDIKNLKILLQYSGGKDSTACLLRMKLDGLHFEAIHFYHAYSYDLPTDEAKRICSDFKISLNIVDITEEIKKIFLTDFNLRPCRFCKSVMDRITLEYAMNNGFNLICVGDNKNDATLIRRIGKNSIPDLKIAKYFNRDVLLPKDMYIYRPMIDLTSDEILKFLKDNHVEVNRIGDTGDKYFEYSREGCPLQFKDFGVKYSSKLMSDLKKYNEICSEFAKSNNIRAAIHLPSEFIVTVPRGYEKMCREYLIKEGCVLSKNIVVEDVIKVCHFSVQIYRELFEESLMATALTRFFERMNCTVTNKEVSDKKFVFDAGKMKMVAFIEPANFKLYAHLTSIEEISIEFVENILLEIFHTAKIEIKNVSGSVQHKNSSLLRFIPNCRFLLGNSLSKNFIRSSSLENISRDDLLLLKSFNVSVIVNLRCSENPQMVEMITSEGIEYKKFFMRTVAQKSFEKIYEKKNIVESYMNFVSRYDILGKIFKTFVSNEGVILFFCKHGRDRSGIISIILELLAGVQIEEIVADYLYSDVLLNSEDIRLREVKQLACFEFVNKFLEEYISVENYLNLLRLSQEQIEQLRFKVKGDFVE